MAKRSNEPALKTQTPRTQGVSLIDPAFKSGRAITAAKAPKKTFHQVTNHTVPKTQTMATP
jgi:hypothetical protein